MHRMMLAGAVAGAALLTSYGTALAQLVIETPAAGVYIAPPGSYDYETYRTGPRVYGYTRFYRDADDDDVVVERPAYRGGCGTYHYWDGLRCVDARR